MSKKCVKCGQLLPEKASFCPHCTAVQTEKQEVKAPGRWKKKVVTGAVLAVLAAAVGMAFSQYHRPRSYEGGAQIIYPNEEKSYKVLLTFSEGDGVAGQAEKERTDRIAEGMDSALPCQLYVLDEESGALAWEEFVSEVESCEVETKPGEDSKQMDYSEPVHQESFPNAAYVSNIHYLSDSGVNDIVWNLTMKNGDTISLGTRLTVEKQEAVTYHPEDAPMETAEELNALLASIDEEYSSDILVYLYLPAVTYEGDIMFGDHTFGIYGSTEGDEMTAFTGTVRLQGKNGNSADLFGLRFAGDSGIGVDAYCFVYISGCSFDGFDTAAIARNGGWVCAADSTFTNNRTALKFNTSMAYGTCPTYQNDTFTGNGTAVCIDSLPGNEVLDFSGSVFSGNEADIVNKAEHPVNTANASFD